MDRHCPANQQSQLLLMKKCRRKSLWKTKSLETYKTQGHDEKTKVFGNTEKSGRIDKFYTFNKKNEAFQALLDEEYERIKMEKNRWQTKSWPLPEETAFLKKQS